MNLQRLRQMDLAEIAGRTRMEASKLWDRVALSVPRRGLEGTVDAGRALASFSAAAPARFFAGATDPSTPGLLARHAPASTRKVMARARRTLAGRFDLLGYRGLGFGDPIDWHLDPIARRRAPRVHWSRLDPLDAATVGDSKVVWELNRHQWMVALGQAYRLTGDEGHARAFARHVTAWLEANPMGRGINWASSLEVALRLIAWSWALVLFRRSSALGPELFERLEGSIEEHATHVEKYLSSYFSPNTHLTGEALGLFYAGTLFPDGAAAGRWRDRGAEILLDQTARQMLPDGVYFEQSACYQRYTVEIALHFLVLAARGGRAVPAALAERTQAMLDFLLAIASPRGEAPPIGDADGGWLLPLAPRSPGDVRGVFAVAAALFGRADYARIARGVAPELVWLLGADGVERFQALVPVPPAGRPSRLFAEGGYAVMRDGWSAERHQMIFDVGPLGCPLSGGHGHADLLSVQCSAFGQPFLVDGGTGTYADRRWRRFFRGTAAHSTVMVDGVGQAVPSAAPFAWDERDRPRARLRRWISTDQLDFADAEHDAYARLPQPVRHRRRVLFVKPRYWVLLDDLEGEGTHDVEQRFQFGPVAVSLEGGRWVRATAAGRALLLRSFAPVVLVPRSVQGRRNPMEGWISADYGRQQPAPVVVYSARAPLPLRILTVIVPSADPTAPPPSVDPLVRREGLVGVVFDGDEVVVDDADPGFRRAAVGAEIR